MLMLRLPVGGLTAFATVTDLFTPGTVLKNQWTRRIRASAW